MRVSFALLAAAAAFVLALPAAASISVGAFLTKVETLREQGPTGLLSPDFQLVRGETQQAAVAVSAIDNERRSEGRAPLACVPNDERLTVPNLLAGLAMLTPSEKAMPFQAGYALVLARRFPCR